MLLCRFPPVPRAIPHLNPPPTQRPSPAPHTVPLLRIPLSRYPHQQFLQPCAIVFHTLTLMSSFPRTLRICPPVEPEAPQRGQDPLLQESDPAVVQLHDDGEGRVGAQHHVVDHGGVVGHPDAVGARCGLGAVVPAGATRQAGRGTARGR